MVKHALFSAPQRTARLLGAFLVSAVAIAVCYQEPSLSSQSAPSEIVISQVYGGGGNSGATFKHDFIELFNRGNTAVDVTGWSVQYAPAATASWQVTVLSGSIAPGHYYLIQQAQGAGGSVSLPVPDATDTTALNAATGKVALVNHSTPLSGSCPSGPGIIDLVGYGGSASCFEGSGPAANLSNTTAALRDAAGCADTNNNAADFADGAPTPRNSASPQNLCLVPSNPTGMGAASPSLVAPGGSVSLTVAVTPGTNPTSTAHSLMMARRATRLPEMVSSRFRLPSPRTLFPARRP
jgi:predicted extracellular nuclease